MENRVAKFNSYWDDNELFMVHRFIIEELITLRLLS